MCYLWISMAKYGLLSGFYSYEAMKNLLYISFNDRYLTRQIL